MTMLSAQWDFLYWKDNIFILNLGPGKYEIAAMWQTTISIFFFQRTCVQFDANFNGMHPVKDKLKLVQILAWAWLSNVENKTIQWHYISIMVPEKVSQHWVSFWKILTHWCWMIWITDANDPVMQSWCHITPTYWGQDKMSAIFQASFSNAISSMKMHEFQLRFHWSLFLRVQSTIFEHWFS